MTGQFWKPGFDPSSAVGGTLTFDRGSGLRLTVLDSLSKELDDDDLFADPSDELTLLGVLHERSQPITITGCLLKSASRSYSGWSVSKATYVGETAFLGAHIENHQDHLFERANLTVDTLDSWAAKHRFDYEFPVDRSETRSAAWSDPGIHVAQTQAAEVTVGTSISGNYSGREVSFAQRAQLTIKPTVEMTFEDLRSQLVHPLYNLSTLLAGRPSAIEEFVIYSQSIQLATRPSPMPIEVLYSPIYDGAPTTDDHTYLSHLGEMDVEWQHLVDRWLNISNDGDLGPALNIYFGTRYRKGGYTETRFLYLASACESIHTIRNPHSGAEPSEKFEARVVAIKSAAAESDALKHKDRKWLKGKLTNEMTITGRLDELFEGSASCFPPGMPSAPAISDRLASTRNHIAHGMSPPDTTPYGGTDLFWAEQLLDLLVQTVLLRELGIAPDIIREAWTRSSYYAWAREGFAGVSW